MNYDLDSILSQSIERDILEGLANNKFHLVVEMLKKQVRPPKNVFKRLFIKKRITTKEKYYHHVIEIISGDLSSISIISEYDLLEQNDYLSYLNELSYLFIILRKNKQESKVKTLSLVLYSYLGRISFNSLAFFLSGKDMNKLKEEINPVRWGKTFGYIIQELRMFFHEDLNYSMALDCCLQEERIGSSLYREDPSKLGEIMFASAMYYEDNFYDEEEKARFYEDVYDKLTPYVKRIISEKTNYEELKTLSIFLASSHKLDAFHRKYDKELKEKAEKCIADNNF